MTLRKIVSSLILAGLAAAFALPAGAASSSSKSTSRYSSESNTYSSSDSSGGASSSMISSGSRSELAFNGVDGTHRVGDDKLEVRHGTLLLNGVSYGSVDSHSSVKYSVKGERKMLTVDGTARRPRN